MTFSQPSIMSTSSALALVVWSSMGMLATASPQSVNNVTIYGPAELDSRVSNVFLGCLNNTGVEYNLFVDSGTTVVVPTTSRDVNFDGEDQGLFQCIIDANYQMQLAAESAVYPHDENENAAPIKSVTHQWLIEQGALGKSPVGVRPARKVKTGAEAASSTNGTSIGRRASNEPRTLSLHYWTYLSDHTSCSSVDLEASFSGHCHSYATAYLSVQFENTDSSEYLHMTPWPHHQFSKGNVRRIVISPGTLGECQNRKTYSFQGTFSRCKSC